MHEERSRLADTQRALMNMLEDIEVERAEAEQAKSLLETVNRELEAFSYSVSHDLRAPLRAISGFAEAVVEDYAPRLDAEGKRYLGLIQDNAHQMGQLIDDLLAFSRLGRQQMSETQIDMEALAKAVFDELAAQAPGRQIAFAVRLRPAGPGRQALVRQVLVNLLSNAIKFTRTTAGGGHRVRLSAGVGRRRLLRQGQRRGVRHAVRRQALRGLPAAALGRRSSRARAWGWRWSSGSSPGTGDGCGREGAGGPGGDLLLHPAGREKRQVNDDEVEIVIVEDNPNDAELITRVLRKHNLANKIVLLKDGAEALDFLFAQGSFAGRSINGSPRSSCWT